MNNVCFDYVEVALRPLPGEILEQAGVGVGEAEVDRKVQGFERITLGEREAATLKRKLRRRGRLGCEDGIVVAKLLLRG